MTNIDQKTELERRFQELDGQAEGLRYLLSGLLPDDGRIPALKRSGLKLVSEMQSVRDEYAKLLDTASQKA